MRRSPKDAFSEIEKRIEGNWKEKWNLKENGCPEEEFMRIVNPE
jgi:hypothetical protein